MAERFRTATLELDIVEHGAKIPVTTSVGVAVCPDAVGTTPAELLRRADEALYRAKQSGRNATWYWDQARRGPAPFDASTPPGARAGITGVRPPPARSRSR